MAQGAEPPGLRLVEVLARGTQSVLPPSIHPHTGQPYLWLDPEALSDFEFVALNQALRLDELPALGSDNLRGLRVIAERISGRTRAHNHAVAFVDRGPCRPFRARARHAIAAMPRRS